MVKPIPLVALGTLLLPTTNAIYTKQSPVLQIDSTNYDRLIAKSNYTSIVEFYAPWCGHCQSLKPAYEKAAKSLTGLAKVAAIDCDEEANKPFCGSMGVQGFPTLKIVRPSKKVGRPTVEDYKGQRTAKAMVDAVIDKIPNLVNRLKDSEYASWLAADDVPKAILFSSKGVVSALLKSVAIDFQGRVDVAQIRDKETEAVEQFKIDKFPTLVLLPGGGKDPVTYDGEMKKETIVKFISQAASPNPDPAPVTKKAKASGGDKSKASKASSKLAKSSASQASAQAQTDAASQTMESLENEPTASPDPRVGTQKIPVDIPYDDLAPPIPPLQDGLSLQQKCLNDKAGTCVLAFLPDTVTPSLRVIQAIGSLSEIHHKFTKSGRTIFSFYQLTNSNSQALALRKALKLSSDVEVIAINSKRGWWRHFTAAEFNERNVEDWIDAIRMGDLSKSDIPAGVVVSATDLPAEPVKLETESPELKAMKESMKAGMPQGMDFELEEVSDDEYEKLMNQGGPESGEAAHPRDEL